MKKARFRVGARERGKKERGRSPEWEVIISHERNESKKPGARMGHSRDPRREQRPEIQTEGDEQDEPENREIYQRPHAHGPADCGCVPGRHDRQRRHRAPRPEGDRGSAEYAAQLEAYKAEQARQIQAEYFLTGEASREAAMNQEADAIARAIGPMKTKRMKMTMCWNILARVDNPAYPGSVQEVVEQPQQWMFYTADNPIREDDREIALMQLRMWHEGRYPSGLTTAMVYAEWSENDYVLRDTWEKTSSTNYWRMPE